MNTLSDTAQVKIQRYAEIIKQILISEPSQTVISVLGEQIEKIVNTKLTLAPQIF